MSVFPILDTAITLAFLYLLFALTCTTLNEIIASAFDRRAVFLRRGIDQLLGDKTLTDQLYQHPSIVSLSRPRKNGVTKPSYISGERFAGTLTDYLTGTQPLTSADAIQAGIKRLPPGTAVQLQALFDVAKGDTDDFRHRVAAWYEETMDRVSGWYKRFVQRQTYVIAAIFVLALNLDSIQLFNRAWSDSALRSTALDEAKARIDALGSVQVPVMEYTEGDKPNAGTPVLTGTASLTDSEQQMLTSLQGWRDDRSRLAADIVVKGDGLGVRSAWLAGAASSHAFGWLVTLLAISLGAPFWFDVLNRFMNLRHAGRAPDEPRTKA